MAHRTSFLIFVGACLALAACNSGPSSSASSSSQRDEAAILERRTEHIEGLLARRTLAAEVLDTLISDLPDRVWLTEVTYGAGKVQVKGKAPSNNLVADYLSRLEGRPALTSVVLRSSAMKIVRGRNSRNSRSRLSRAMPRIPPPPQACLWPPASKSSRDPSRPVKTTPKCSGISSGSHSRPAFK